LVSVRLTMAKKEPDGDIRSIVTSPDQAQELVVEFPTLNCTDASPKKQMENARQQSSRSKNASPVEWTRQRTGGGGRTAVTRRT
jgi:hypothetical protein